MLGFDDDSFYEKIMHLASYSTLPGNIIGIINKESNSYTI